MVKKNLKFFGIAYGFCWIIAGVYYFQNKCEVEFKLSQYIHNRQVKKNLNYFKKSGYVCTGRAIEDCLAAIYTKDPGFLYASDLISFKNSYLEICKEGCFNETASYSGWYRMLNLVNMQALWIVRQQRNKGEQKQMN
jgi:hypothetical protein